MDLTIPDIKKDIAGFEERIAKAKTELAALPKGYLPYPEHNCRGKQRREYESECSHCKQLIAYGKEGIEIRKKDIDTE
jgi:hypothetical protein